MSFNTTSCDIHLSAEGDGTHLGAICNNDVGSGVTADLLLDQYLGNKDGKKLLYPIVPRVHLTFSSGCRSLWVGRDELQQERPEYNRVQRRTRSKTHSSLWASESVGEICLRWNRPCWSHRERRGWTAIQARRLTQLLEVHFQLQKLFNQIECIHCFDFQIIVHF